MVYGSAQARGETGAAAAATATATAMPDSSHICDLYHSSKQHWVLNPLIKPASSWIVVGSVTAEPRWEIRSC